MSTTHQTSDGQQRRERTVRTALWLPGLLVALGAAVATAHARRLLQAVEDSPTDLLASLVEDRAECDELWARYEAACSGLPTPRTSTEENVPQPAVLGGEAR